MTAGGPSYLRAVSADAAPGLRPGTVIGHCVPREAAFTLLEILVAFAVLATGLTLITAAIGRHLAALQILESSLSAQQVAQARMLREIARRGDELEIPADPSEERFNPRIDVVPVTLETDPLRGLKMEQVTSEVSWAVRQQPRALQLTAGFGAPPASRGRDDLAPFMAVEEDE